MKQLLLLLVSSSFVYFQVNAQRNGTDPNVIFSQSGSSKYNNNNYKRPGETNIIKLAPLGIFGGTFPILYERRINDYLSIQGGLGLTGRNYCRGLLVQDMATLDYPVDIDSNDDDVEAIYNFDTRTSKMGYMFSIQPRFYFKSEALEGGFFGVSLDHYRYNFQVPGLKSNPNSQYSTINDGSFRKEYENISDVMGLFGYQNIYDRLTFEYFFAWGIRFVRGEKYYATIDRDQFKDGYAPYKQNILNVNLGIRVGYHF